MNYVAFGAFTGRGIKFLLNNNNCFSEINIIAALVEGVKWDNGKTSSIIEIGGQSSKYIAGLRGEGSHITVESSSDCAAGTGSFLEEQISRFNYKIEDYSSLIEKAETIPRIAGRCSVFAKTDITHHIQEGVSVNDLLLGLAYSVVRNFNNLVLKKGFIEKPVFLAGGSAYNKGIVLAVRDIFKLEEHDLIIPENKGIYGAVGASIIAEKKQNKNVI